jgi:hypothetical protein
MFPLGAVKEQVLSGIVWVPHQTGVEKTVVVVAL